MNIHEYRNPAHPGISPIKILPRHRDTLIQDDLQDIFLAKFCCEWGFAIEKVRLIWHSMVHKSMHAVLEIGGGYSGYRQLG